MQKQLQIDKKTALIIIDVQNCFLKGGSLAVEGGNEIIPLINQLREKFETVILTQDSRTNINAAAFSSTSAVYKLVLWVYVLLF